MARLSHDEYLKSNVWKCDKSPVNKDIKLQVENNTGAHHWTGIKEGEKDATLFYCKYCMDTKRFPTTFKDAIEILNKGRMPPLVSKVSTSNPSSYKKRRGK